MKWNRHVRKSFLVAAICLALSDSVFAMPQGGIVDPASTATIAGLVGGMIGVNNGAGIASASQVAIR